MTRDKYSETEGPCLTHKAEVCEECAYFRGKLDGFNECRKILTLTTQDLLLMCGEMTQQEIRTVRAVLKCLSGKLILRSKEHYENSKLDKGL